MANETIADIIAELRGIRVREFQDYADRIEAAHRRELEALEEIIDGYEKADFCDMNYGEWCHDPANVCANAPLCKAMHEARAALAATENEGGNNANK